MPCGILNKVLYREGPPRVQPFTLLHTIFDRKGTLSYTIFIRLIREVSYSGSLLLVLIQFFGGVGGEGGWGVGGCLLTSSAFRMGAYSGWVLIRG